MAKYRYMAIFLLGLSLQLLAEEVGYDQFCGTKAKILLKDLNEKNPKYLEIISQIEAKKNLYNQEMAKEVLKRDTQQISKKSALLNELINELDAEISEAFKNNNNIEQINFNSICNKKPKIRICKLPTDKRTSVEASIENYKKAKILESSPIQGDTVAATEVAVFTNEEITDADIAALKYPDAKRDEIQTPELQAIVNSIDELYKTKGFKEFENLKKFVGEKFLRSCSYKKTPTEIASTCGEAGIPEIFNLEIADENFKIISALSSQEGTVSTFSKAEIKEYKNMCDKTAKDEASFTEICSLIYKEYNETMPKREAADWAALHKDNYIISDPHSPEGFRIEPKEKMSTIFLGALAPMVQNFTPFWMYNIQLESQISIMTQQSIYQQQYMNYTATNPYGYYQGSYLPTNSLSAGFNFGP